VRLVTEADDDLIISVAHDLVARTAPQELPLFRATSAAYLTDPERVLRAKPQKDEVLGFGLEGVVVFLTPAALEIAKAVVSFLAAQVRGAVAKEASDTIAQHVHDLFHPPHRSEPNPGEPSPVPALDDEQLKLVHDLALEKARALALPEPQAELLADAMVGSLVAA
jgi:hypothetical protein